MPEKIRILKTTSTLFILTLLAKALQIFIFPLVANYFGTSGEVESFFVALSIPTFVASTLLGGFGIVFIPIFTEQKLRYGEKKAWEFATSLMNMVLLATILFTIIGAVLSPRLIYFIAPGMESVYKNIGAELTQFLFITVIFFALTTILTAVLNSYQAFIIPAVAAIVGNLILIATIMIVKQKIGIYVLAAAFILSGGCSVALLLMASRRLWKGSYNLKIDSKQLVIKDALKMFMAVSFIGILGQIILIVNRFFASFLPTGSIAMLEYASRPVFFIIELLILSVATPIYQKMSSEAAMDDKTGLRDTFSLALKMIAVVLLPVTAFIVFLRVPIFTLLLEHGKFSSQNTAEVSSVFLFLSMVMVGSGFGQIIVNTFYAMKKMKLLVIISVSGVLLNILLDALFFKPMGIEGVALATGISAVSGALLALIVLNKEIGGLDWVYLLPFILKTFIAAVLAGGAGWLLFLFSDIFIKIYFFLGQLVMLSVSAIVCGVIYALLMSFFRVNEFNLVLNIIKERFRIAQTKLS